jgi:hypothetical protein
MASTERYHFRIRKSSYQELKGIRLTKHGLQCVSVDSKFDLLLLYFQLQCIIENLFALPGHVGVLSVHDTIALIPFQHLAEPANTFWFWWLLRRVWATCMVWLGVFGFVSFFSPPLRM